MFVLRQRVRPPGRMEIPNWQQCPQLPTSLCIVLSRASLGAISRVRFFSVTNSNRPSLTPQLTGTDLLRWYWLKEELAEFARQLEVRATGSKELLTKRIAAKLDGVPFTEPQSAKKTDGAQLSGPLTLTTTIPKGQRCSQFVRAWFVEQVGPAFSFDAETRAFFSQTDGTQTLQNALDHYRATRNQETKSIDPQFEYNRFTRAWYEANPMGRREDLIRDWQKYRSLPIDQRGRA